MTKVILEGHIVIQDCDLATVLAELPNHIRLTRNEEGCLKFDVTQSPDENNVFYVYEEFIDRPAFQFHQSRVQCSDWGKVSANVERHYKVNEAP